MVVTEVIEVPRSLEESFSESCASLSRASAARSRLSLRQALEGLATRLGAAR